MNENSDPTTPNPFDAETWALLPSFFDKLPNPIHLHLWGDPALTKGEREAQELGRTLANHFGMIDFALFPRRVNYDYYPVLGVFGEKEGQKIDYGVRIIGLPTGYQLTSLIAAIQVVSFRGVTLEPKTRVQLQGLKEKVDIEILASADSEASAVIAKSAFGLAVANPFIRAFLIMADMFPEAAMRYSTDYLPHTILNGRYHIEGVPDEETLLRHIAKSFKNQS